jgi:hypothetical protein
MRKLDGTEFSAKKERADTVTERKGELEALRESWERVGNRHLERHGFEPTIGSEVASRSGPRPRADHSSRKAGCSRSRPAGGCKPASYPKALNQSPISLL